MPLFYIKKGNKPITGFIPKHKTGESTACASAHAPFPRRTYILYIDFYNNIFKSVSLSVLWTFSHKCLYIFPCNHYCTEINIFLSWQNIFILMANYKLSSSSSKTTKNNPKKIPKNPSSEQTPAAPTSSSSFSHIFLLYLFFQPPENSHFTRLEKKKNPKKDKKRRGGYLVCIYTKEMRKTLLDISHEKAINIHSIRL